jgi:cation transporter-like permease
LRDSGAGSSRLHGHGLVVVASAVVGVVSLIVGGDGTGTVVEVAIVCGRVLGEGAVVVSFALVEVVR